MPGLILKNNKEYYTSWDIDINVKKWWWDGMMGCGWDDSENSFVEQQSIWYMDE